jgi:exodeoxyribonuclease VII small subunit
MSDKTMQPADSMAFEEAADELDAIVKRIDAGEADLETMMKEHARGQLLIKRCRTLLADAEQQLKIVESKEID